MNELTIAILSGLAGMLGWGVSDFFAKKVIANIGSLRTAIGLQIFGGAALLAVYLAAGNGVPALDARSVLQLTGLAGLNVLGYLLLYKAFEKGTLSIISPIAASSCGISVLICTFFLQETMSAKKAAGLLCIFIGILVTSIDFKEIRQNWGEGALKKGVLEALGVMIVMGLWFPLWGEFMKGRELLFWSTGLKVLMGVIMMGYFLFQAPISGLVTTLRLAGPVIVVIALIDVFAYLAVSYGFYATVNQTSLITVLAHAYSIPTLFLAYILLHERVTHSQKSGILMILAGIVVTSYS